MKLNGFLRAIQCLNNYRHRRFRSLMISYKMLFEYGNYEHPKIFVLFILCFLNISRLAFIYISQSFCQLFLMHEGRIRVSNKAFAMFEIGENIGSDDSPRYSQLLLIFSLSHSLCLYLCFFLSAPF